MKVPFIKEALTQVFQKPSTLKYPEVKRNVPEHYRGRLKFYPDRCIACGMCMRVCAPSSITKTVEKTPEGDKITMRFDMLSCTFCGMCADFCMKKSIELTSDYSMVSENGEDIDVSGTFIKKPPVRKTVPPKPEINKSL